MGPGEGTSLNNQEIKISPELERMINQVVPDEATAIGFVACNLAGELLLVEPAKHFNDVSCTFPKVERKSSEQPSETLLRCLQEKIGARPDTIYLVPQLLETKHSRAMFFAGLVSTKTNPTSGYVQTVQWHSTESARQRLQTSKNLGSRQRDLSLLEIVSQMCLTPERRLLLAVQELHKMGFEQLRIFPSLAPSGMYWRCSLVPKSCISDRHGAIADMERLHKLLQLAGSNCQELRHSSGSQQFIFDWKDSGFDSPKELAHKCLKRSREVVFAGWGEDHQYVRWYEDMLRMTSPGGVVFAIADWDLPADRLPTTRTASKVWVPLPPK